MHVDVALNNLCRRRGFCNFINTHEVLFRFTPPKNINCKFDIWYIYSILKFDILGKVLATWPPQTKIQNPHIRKLQQKAQDNLHK